MKYAAHKVALAVMLLPSFAYANYQLRIVEPAEDRSYMRPAQMVEVALSLSPKLGETDKLTLSIDGEVVAENALSHHFASHDYDPGEHVLSTTITDRDGRVLAQDTRHIYLIQNTVIIREKRAAVKAEAEYNALPWYKKLQVKIRKKD